QAEDGIRDLIVTGVQTCALPIFPAIDDLRNLLSIGEVTVQLAPAKWIAENTAKFYAGKEESIVDIIQQLESDTTIGGRRGETSKIGRASCRERGQIEVIRRTTRI